MIFVVGLTYLITPKGHVFIGRRCDLLYDQKKKHGDLCGQFDLVYDPKGQRVIREKSTRKLII